MSCLAITGANGFIGHTLVRRCIELGYDVITLSRRPTNEGHWISWQLGEPLPLECASVDAVVHLASATLVARDKTNEAVDLDFLGTRLLSENAWSIYSKDRPVRFIFLSSQSASAMAKNQYGQSKHAIECSLVHENEVIVRPGLVYGDEGQSVFGMFQKLSRMPLVPVISGVPNIHPIHVNELIECIVRIIETQRPQKLYCLGASTPLTFAEAIVATSVRDGRRAPLKIQLPLAFVKAVAWIVDKCLHMSPSISERIDGLLALQPMQTENSIKELGVSICSFISTNAQQKNSKGDYFDVPRV
jgi:nucleoside-diphosphate-sugar epimerase